MSVPTIPVVCPSCSAKIKAPPTMAGRKAKCPKCGAAITVGPGSPSTSERPDTDSGSKGSVIQSEPAAQDGETAAKVGREQVHCPACREPLKGHVARCPHCTSVLNWMNCGTCKRVVATRVTQKFVGVARGGHQPVYHCIHCGTKLAGPDCFIATAAYGSAHEPSVQVLRSFRDRVLVRSRLGCAFVSAYYAVSPDLAARLRGHTTACWVIRVLLTPFVWVARQV